MGEHIRCVYDSLALNYLNCIEQLESITGKKYSTIHVIGGGSQNKFLNQLTADTTGRRVLAGPVEAATLGNAVMQYMCIGLIPSIWEARRILRESLELKEYYPCDELELETAFSRYKSLITTRLHSQCK
jgi:rhamnulokinase